MKLHLGCGTNILEGWVNVDIGSDDPRVTSGDVRDLDGIAPDGSADEIYACHVLEHIPRADEIPVLSHWCRKLRPGGACFVAVPDFNYLVSEYVRATGRGEPWWTLPIIEPLMGGAADGSHDKYNHHQSPFDFAFLTYLMTEAGFVDVRRYDPSEMGFDPGDHSLRPLSLNVVGYRPTDPTAAPQPRFERAEAVPSASVPVDDSVDRVLQAQAARFRTAVERVVGPKLAGPVVSAAHLLTGLTRPVRRWMARRRSVSG
jgi:predicted SAM-dependent methyltransferase